MKQLIVFLQSKSNSSLFLFFFVIILFFGTFSIYLTPKNEALLYDANSYYIAAQDLLHNDNLIEYFRNIFFPPSGHFIDFGYPVVLSIIMFFFGSNSIVVFQYLNYIIWFLACLFLFKNLQLFYDREHSFLLTLPMVLSPLFLSFSAKLYSEPLSALGFSMILFYVSLGIKNESFSIYQQLLFAVGCFLFFASKSIFIFGVIFLLGLGLYFRHKSYITGILLGILLISGNLISSLGGGRSEYNFAIQTAKVNQGASVILSCSLYFVSYPVGKALIPQVEGACHQNDPDSSMPLYSINPYVHTRSNWETSHFTYSEGFRRIFSQPLEYFLVVLTSMFNLVLVEGIYPSVLLKFSSVFIGVGWLFFKLIWSLLLWGFVFKCLFKTFKQNLPLGFLLVTPLIYFVVIVGNFPVEQRYFYPLIPWLYLCFGLSFLKKLRYTK